jgi:FMN-dependent NADH-azoreductase
MAQLLHIDSSVRGDVSVSRRLGVRAAERWLATHPGGTVTYRDLAVAPIPHVDAATFTARLVPAGQRMPAQEEAVARIVGMVEEVNNADAVLRSACRCATLAHRARSRHGWITSSRQACRSTPNPARDSSAAPTSSCWVAAERIRSGHSARRVGPRELAVVRRVADRVAAAVHHRRAHDGRCGSGDADLKSLAAESLARALQAIDRLWTASDIAV